MIKTETQKETEGVMNALKFRMVTGMIAFTMARLVTENKTPGYLRDRMYLTFENARRSSDLVRALYQQTQPYLPRRHQESYLAAVIIEDIQYIILGTYEEWKTFYAMKWEYFMNECPQGYSPN
jgi:hypothetical protein